MLSAVAELQDLKDKLAKAQKTIDELKKELETQSTKQHLQFSVENVRNSKIKNLFRYYTGFQYQEYQNLCTFLHVPEENAEQTSPIKFLKNCNAVKQLPLREQLFMVLIKLRHNLDTKDLGYRFQISQQTTSLIFNSWINYMFYRLGEISTWPHRLTIQKFMTAQYKKDFPNTFAILDGTEIRIQKPSSLKVQSQCYSDYKSTTTLKSLVVCDPFGSVMFSSTLFTGSMSDKEIFEQSGLRRQLQGLLECGYLMKGDGLMADKGFNIEQEVANLGLQLNIPPFAKSGMQMPMGDVEQTKKIAKHRVHVERAIAKIKKFKIVAGRVRNVTLGSVNQIWFVCSMLTNFQPPIIAKKT